MAKKPFKFKDSKSGAKQHPHVFNDVDSDDRGVQPLKHKSIHEYSDDELADELYGGFGYSGPRMHGSGKNSGTHKPAYDYSDYRYDDYGGYTYGSTIDDSEKDWYKKNSFKYSRVTDDYSPSSLFRSTFTSRSYYSYSTGASIGSMDSQNKLVRVLRSLTRSANTIVDKDGGKKMVEYVVQCASGDNVNGTVESLTDDKKPIVYVPGEEILAATNADEEDAAVDALTGFVLLRVQMARTVHKNVSAEINNTDISRAMSRVFVNLKALVETGTLSTFDPVATAAEQTDTMLAGILAKSMLTRVARRSVIKNWGGFAPYFIRHAKKFKAVRENLVKAAVSVESVVGRISYNMLEDEEPIELDEKITKVVSDYLGKEVANDKILPVCRKLVAELRALLATYPEATPGEVESVLADMFSKLKAEMEEAAKVYTETKEALTSTGNSFYDWIASSQQSRCLPDPARDRLDNLLNKEDPTAASGALLHQILVELAASKTNVNKIRAVLADPTPGDATDKGRVVQEYIDIQNQVAYAVSSRPSALRTLSKQDLLTVANARDAMLTNYAAWPTCLDAVEHGLKQIETIEAVLQATAGKMAGKDPAPVKAVMADFKSLLEQRATAAENVHAEIVKKKTELQDKLRKDRAELSKKTVSLYERIFGALDVLAKNLSHNVLPDLRAHTADIDRAAAILEAADTATPAGQTQIAGCVTVVSNINTYLGGDPSRFVPGSLRAGGQINVLRSEINCSIVDGRDNKPNVVEDAVKLAMANPESSGSNPMVSAAGAVGGFNSIALSGIDPTTDEGKELAAKLGVSPETLQEMVDAFKLASMTPMSHTDAQAAAVKLKLALENSQPVDEKLFGAVVAKDGKVMTLTPDAVNQANSEARNAQEEEYVAYLESGDSNSYRPATVFKTEEPVARCKTIKQIQAANRGIIARIKDVLQFQSLRRTVETHGHRSGDLDEGSLHKLNYDCDHIWTQKTVSRLPDVAVGILVDQSGSMGGQKIQQAQELCAILASAVNKIAGVRLYVYGHTANLHKAKKSSLTTTLYKHYEPQNGNDLSKIQNIRAHCNNYDGYAIKAAAQELAKDPAKRKYLFVIADGMPSGEGYGGPSAKKHVASVCAYARKMLKIETLAFAVGVGTNARMMKEFTDQYGVKKTVFVDQLRKCLPVIVRFLRKTLRQERTLIAAE